MLRIKGSQYNSMPDIEIISTGSGSGAIIRPVISNGLIVDTVVINTGIGYDNLTTEVRIKETGKNGLFGARVRNLTLNTTKDLVIKI